MKAGEKGMVVTGARKTDGTTVRTDSMKTTGFIMIGAIHVICMHAMIVRAGARMIAGIPMKGIIMEVTTMEDMQVTTRMNMTVA
jgi:hypothetical protein